MARSLLMLSLLLSVPLAGAEKRGTLAFHYGGALSAAQLEYFGKFDVLVTHDPLPTAQATALRRGGTKLALYEWSVAFYRSLVRPGSWQEQALRKPAIPLLNRTGLRGHAGANDADAFYYDPAAPGHAEGRANDLAKWIRSVGYDGVFFDTTTIENVHPEARREYRRRHPDITYDKAFSQFLARLRNLLPLIVTNQGYRVAEHYLPHADYDITESLLSLPWHDHENRWNSVDFLVPEMILPAAAKYPHVRFVHLSYVASEDPQRVETLIATAMLFGHDAFVTYPDVSRTLFSKLHFADLGPALGPIEMQGLTASRRFERGRVVVTPARGKIELAVP